MDIYECMYMYVCVSERKLKLSKGVRFLSSIVYY